MNLLSLAQALKAIDITDKNFEEIQGINKIEVIYRRYGKYGLNGLLFRDSKDRFFLIRQRNSNLFYFA